MFTKNDIEEIQIINEVLNCTNENIKLLMEEVLSKYKYVTEQLIIDTAKFLSETTPYFWERVIKSKNYEETIKLHSGQVVNFGIDDTSYKTIEGNIETLALRCANLDTYYKITERKNGYIPKNIKLLNENNYNTISYQELLNIIIYADKTNDKDIEIVKQALIHTFKEKISKSAKNIIKEFYEKLNNLYLECSDELKSIEDRIKRNNEEKKSILKKNKKLESDMETFCKDNDFSIEKYYNEFYNIKRNKEYKEHASLPKRLVVNDLVNSFNEDMKNTIEFNNFDESKLNINTDKDGNKIWEWLISVYISNDILSTHGTVTRFTKVPEKLLELIKIVKEELLPIKLEYKKDKDFQQRYNEYDYYLPNNDKKEKTYLYNYETGTLQIFHLWDTIDVEELIERIEKIKKLTQEVLKNEIEIDISDPKIKEDMKESIKENIGLGNTGLSCIEDYYLEDIYNWGITTTYSKEKVENYVNYILYLIEKIEKIIKSAKDNNKKAIFFNEYTDYYKKLSELYDIYNSYMTTIKNNSDKCTQLDEENEKLNNDFEKTSYLINSILYFKSIIKESKILKK